MLGRRAVTLQRFPDGAYLNGVYQKAPPLTSTILASVQPASGRDLEPLPEGRRSTRTVKVYTDAALRTARDGKQADTLIIDGEEFAVVMVANHASKILSHTKALAQAK